MYEGRFVGSFPAAEAEIGRIGLLMTGGGEDDVAHPVTRARRRSARRATGDVPPRAAPLTPRWLSPALTLGAIAVALVISGAIIAVVGGDPIASYLHILDASFGSIGVLSDTLVKATPLILTGLACALAFRMRLWNIGAEGQFLLGAWGASAVVLVPLVPAGTPGIVLIPLMMAAGMLAGGLWGLIPGILRARLGVNEIITTLMLNYIALAWIQFWVFGPWSQGGFQQTKPFPEAAWLPRLTDFADAVPGARRPDRPSRAPVRARRGRRCSGCSSSDRASATRSG